MNKIKTWWKRLANKVNTYETDNKILKFLLRRLSWFMVNTLYFLNVTSLTGLVMFGISFLIDDGNIIGDYFFLFGLIGFAPWIIYGIVAVIYVWIVRPIKYVLIKSSRR